MFQLPGVKARDITLLTRELAMLLQAGLTLEQALEVLTRDSGNAKLARLVERVIERVRGGDALSSALEEQGGHFSGLYVNMVRAGEATGQVDIVLQRLEDFLQRQRALTRKVVSALTYPALMVVIGILVVSILVTVVVPKITDMLQDTGQTMPGPTKILIAVSDWARVYWFIPLLAIAALSYVFSRIYKTNRGQLIIDRFWLKVPIIGELLRKQAVTRFTRTLSTLLSSGVAAVPSLEITQNVVGNRVLADATGHIKTRILEGADIASSLKQTGAFPSVVGYMVAVGEQSGQLEEMLDRIADAYDEEIEVVTERATTLLEPLMIIVLASIVGFIVWAIVLPILQVGNI